MLWLALATGMTLVPSKTKARPRALASLDHDRPPHKQGRRQMDRARAPQRLDPVRSPCGRHVVEVEAGQVRVDGRRVHPSEGASYLISRPTWRSDGAAVAWLERRDGATHLVVVPDLAEATGVLSWELPATAARDEIHWVAKNRVVLGPDLLSPRAVASWTE